jgi:hypothetical protein
MARTLRKGRDRCTASRRDGQRCEAPAVAETLVCRRHGGGAPQVKVAARRRQLQLRAIVTWQEYQEAIGTSRRFDMLCRACRAADALRDFEDAMNAIALLKAELAEQRTTPRANCSQDWSGNDAAKKVDAVGAHLCEQLSECPPPPS